MNCAVGLILFPFFHSVLFRSIHDTIRNCCSFLLFQEFYSFIPPSDGWLKNPLFLTLKNPRKTFLCMSYYVSIYWGFCQIWPGVELLSVRPYTCLISTRIPSTKPLNNFPSYSEWNTKLSKHLQSPFLSPPIYLSYCIFSYSPLHFLRSGHTNLAFLKYLKHALHLCPCACHELCLRTLFSRVYMWFISHWALLKCLLLNRVFPNHQI